MLDMVAAPPIRQVEPPFPPANGTTTTVPPPGWYDDPAGAPLLRYWDGTSFTQATSPKPCGSPAPAGASPGAQAPRDGKRAAAVAFQVIGWVLFLGLVGIKGAAWLDLIGDGDGDHSDAPGYRIGYEMGKDELDAADECLGASYGASAALGGAMTEAESTDVVEDFLAGCTDGFEEREAPWPSG